MQLCISLLTLVMAARERRESGFHPSLNTVSTVDMLPVVKRRKTKRSRTVLGSRDAHYQKRKCKGKLNAVCVLTAFAHLNLLREIPNCL